MEQTRELSVFENEHSGYCSNCGRKILYGETVFVGYDSEEKCAAVCENCKDIIKKLVVKRFHQDRPYKVPDKFARLWRFMDLGKFLSLIQKSELYFRRADCFEDPYEGAKGIKEKETIWDDFYKGFFAGAIKSTKEITGKDVEDSEAYRQSQELLEQFKQICNNQRSRTFINCWHANEYESEAMWNLYTSDSKQGIVIQTTFNNLYLALNRDPYIEIGYVNYIDYNKQFTGVNDSFFYKRYSFAHEREVRCVITDLSLKEPPMGIYRPVDLDYLIENIYVSPTSQPWFYDVVKNIVEKYGLKKKVLQSTLNEPPFY